MNYTLPCEQRDLPRNNINRQVMWWQQDGAPAHTNNVTLKYLRGQFPGRVMSNVETGHGHHVLPNWQFVTFFFFCGVSEATVMGRTSQPTASDSEGTSGCDCLSLQQLTAADD